VVFAPFHNVFSKKVKDSAPKEEHKKVADLEKKGTPSKGKQSGK